MARAKIYRMNNRKRADMKSAGFLTAISAGIGTAIGVATNNIHVGLGIGISIGIILGLAWFKR